MTVKKQPDDVPPEENTDIDDYIRSVVTTDMLNLNDEFVRIPADMGYCNGQYADAMERYLLTKRDLEATRARLYLLHRERLMAEGKTTEAMVDASVSTDPAYDNVHADYISAEVSLLRWRGVCEALRTKKDMLVSLGANIRAEMAGDPMVAKMHREAHNG